MMMYITATVSFVRIYAKLAKRVKCSRKSLCALNMSILVLSLTDITKTCLYNINPLKPHFCIVKVGLQGYTLFFLILLKNIDCGYSLKPPLRGGSNEYPQSMFWAEI